MIPPITMPAMAPPLRVVVFVAGLSSLEEGVMVAVIRVCVGEGAAVMVTVAGGCWFCRFWRMGRLTGSLRERAWLMMFWIDAESTSRGRGFGGWGAILMDGGC